MRSLFQPYLLVLSSAAMLFLMPTMSYGGGIERPIVNAVLKVVAIGAAAKFSEEATQAGGEFLQDTLPPGESIYSVRFDFTRSSWADILTRPDVFLVVECEGGKRLLIPEIENNWNYGVKIYRFRCPTLPAGSKCVLRLYDDDSASDAIWKTILSNKVSWDAEATSTNNAPLLRCIEIRAKVHAEGELSLLEPEQAAALTIDAAELVATAELTVPENLTDRWEMQGEFVNDSTKYGDVQLVHWQASTLPNYVSYLLRPRMVFWSVVLVGAVVWLRTSYRRRYRVTDTKGSKN